MVQDHLQWQHDEGGIDAMAPCSDPAYSLVQQRVLALPYAGIEVAVHTDQHVTLLDDVEPVVGFFRVGFRIGL